MKTFIQKYGHAWILSYGFLYLPWFFHLEESVTSHYHVIHTELDDLIPFSEYFIIPYLLWFVYVGAAIAWFFFTNREDYYRLCTFLFTGMTLCLLICTIFPNGTDLRVSVDPDKNVFCWLVSLIHRADTNTNIFPSIHVYNSIGVHLAVCRSERFRGNRRITALSACLMTAICLSTVFLKQHSVIDVLGAILLAAAVTPLAFGTNAQGERKNQPQLIR